MEFLCCEDTVRTGSFPSTASSLSRLLSASEGFFKAPQPNAHATPRLSPEWFPEECLTALALLLPFSHIAHLLTVSFKADAQSYSPPWPWLFSRPIAFLQLTWLSRTALPKAWVAVPPASSWQQAAEWIYFQRASLPSVLSPLAGSLFSLAGIRTFKSFLFYRHFASLL